MSHFFRGTAVGAVVIASGILSFSLAAAFADEEAVELTKVPKAVLEAVKGRFKDAELTGAGKETENGKLVYEVTIKHKGQKIDVTLSPEGEILVIESTLPAKDLPKPVTKTLDEKYPKATFKIVESVVNVEKKEEKLAYYEVLLVTADNQVIEVQVTAEGKIAGVEKKSAEEAGEEK
jgi:uncharacterized membrane protein YkoI